MHKTIAFIVVLLSLQIAAAAQSVTIAEAQADYTAGQYRPALQKIASILSGGTAKLGSPLRYDLFMLRGECLLQLKQVSLAADAFNSASLSAKAGGDVKRMADPKAMSLLIRASTNMMYKPKSSSPSEPIDIVPPESRKKALEALLADRIAEIKPKFDAALKGTTLPPMQALLPALSDAYLIEIAATGESTQALPMGKELGERARGLINSEMQRLTGRIDELYQLATEPTIGGFGRNDTLGIRGLTSPERDELKQMADYLVKIKQVAQEGRRINIRVGGTGEAWDAIIAEVNEAEERAQQTYDRRY